MSEQSFFPHVKRLLMDSGHTILAGKEGVTSVSAKHTQRIDIISTFNNMLYFTEIKSNVKIELQRGIGQLILHQFSNKDLNNIIYQLAIPKDYNDIITEQLEEYLKIKLNIQILRVGYYNPELR